MNLLQHILIFSLFITSGHTSGEISMFTNSKGLELQGDDPLPSEYVRDVLNVAMGFLARNSVHWSGLYVKNPFYIPQRAIAVLVDDVHHIDLLPGPTKKTYDLDGNYVEDSLIDVLKDFKAERFTTCDIDFKNQGEKKALEDYAACFREPWNAFRVEKTVHLLPNYTIDYNFLQSINIINGAADHLQSIQNKPSFLLIRVTVEPITTAYGKDSLSAREARALLTKALIKLKRLAHKSYNEDLFLVVVADQTFFHIEKRSEGTNPHNIADDYDDDFPVIFNIVLWLSVALAISLFSSSYALMVMNPGRNSIIYRKIPDTTKKKRN